MPPGRFHGEAGLEVEQAGYGKQPFVQVGHGQLAAIGEPADLVPAAQHPVKPSNMAAAGADPREQATEIAGSIADQRHAGAGQGGEDDLSPLPIGQRPGGLRINDLEQQVCLAQVQPLCAPQSTPPPRPVSVVP